MVNIFGDSFYPKISVSSKNAFELHLKENYPMKFTRLNLS